APRRRDDQLRPLPPGADILDPAREPGRGRADGEGQLSRQLRSGPRHPRLRRALPPGAAAGRPADERAHAARRHQCRLRPPRRRREHPPGGRALAAPAPGRGLLPAVLVGRRGGRLSLVLVLVLALPLPLLLQLAALRAQALDLLLQLPNLTLQLGDPVGGGLARAFHPLQLRSGLFQPRLLLVHATLELLRLSPGAIELRRDLLQLGGARRDLLRESGQILPRLGLLVARLIRLRIDLLQLGARGFRAGAQILDLLSRRFQALLLLGELLLRLLELLLRLFALLAKRLDFLLQLRKRRLPALDLGREALTLLLEGRNHFLPLRR